MLKDERLACFERLQRENTRIMGKLRLALPRFNRSKWTHQRPRLILLPAEAHVYRTSAHS